MNAHKAAALAAYNRRNKVLRGLGFSSYEEYLASPLWAEIRERKLDSVGRRCYACGGAATQVHHGSYSEYNLGGPGNQNSYDGDITWERWLEKADLYAVCEKDHAWAEHFLGEKISPELATKRLKNRRRKNRLDEEPVPRAARQGRQERKAREMSNELARLIARDEEEL